MYFIMLDKSNMYVGDFDGIFVNRQAGLNKCIMHSNGLNCVLFWFYCLFLLYFSFIEGRHVLSSPEPKAQGELL